MRITFKKYRTTGAWNPVVSFDVKLDGKKVGLIQADRFSGLFFWYVRDEARGIPPKNTGKDKVDFETAKAQVKQYILECLEKQPECSESPTVTDAVLASGEPFCACGRRISQCDRSRAGCHTGGKS